MFKFRQSIRNNSQNRRRRRVRKAAPSPFNFERLEPRQLLATFTVTNINDAGAGSLRDAITQANAAAGLDNIHFAIGGAGVKTIALASTLPGISSPVVLDGTTQGASSTPLIELNGAGAGATSGLTVTTGGSGSTIRGLAINRFASNGIVLSASDNNLIERCFIGTNAAGTLALANGADGIRVVGANNVIGSLTSGAGNLISGNTRHGLILTGASTTGNDLLGNTIGMNFTRTASVPNVANGVTISAGAKTNDIGGTVSGSRNSISGNGSLGVLIDGNGTDSNRVQGNFIGNGSGNTTGVGNLIGVAIRNGAKSNLIGDTANVAAQNILSGNTQFGVQIQGVSSTGNTLAGNLIGTDSTGVSARPNGLDGVRIDSGANNNTIGGTTAAAMNIISGNTGNGVQITGTGTNNNKVFGNRIGLNAAGSGPISNGQAGVQIAAGAANNLIGDGTGTTNLIAANSAAGVLIRGAGTTGNAVRNNTIGVDIAGTLRPNFTDGVAIIEGATGNTVGGSVSGQSNVIGGHLRAGVQISGNGTNGNSVLANRIGVNSAVTSPLPNTIGIWIAAGAKSNTIGGLTTGERNFISGNSKFGVILSGSGTENNLVLGNHIGVNFSAVASMANGLDGVYIAAGAKNNTIGGSAAGAGNVIAGNGRDGVGIQGLGSDGNNILGNAVGVNFATSGLPNGRIGVFVRNQAAATAIGNTTAGSRNFIGANSGDGIRISGAGVNATIRNNIIGLAVDGVTARGNQMGVRVRDGATATIGGTATGAGNIISSNAVDGIRIEGLGTNGVTVQGNLIGTDITGAVDKGNNGKGIFIFGGVDSATIGGTTAGARNVISGNAQPGIQIDDAITQNVVIQGNLIGTNAAGTAAIANTFGLRITAARNITVGGTTAGSRNVISGNLFDGVLLVGNNVAGPASGNLIQGNFIGLNAAGTGAIPNQDGIEISSYDESAVIGGATAAAANFISGNTRFGVRMNDSTGIRLIGNRIGLRSDGVTPQGNGSHGAFLFNNSSGNSFGGAAAGEGNTIANNGGDGVLVGSDPALGGSFAVAAGAGNSILANLIFANSGQAIDLGANDGATANDSNDVDTGPNNLQNKAGLNFASSLGNSTLITGVLDGTAGNYRIDFFANTGTTFLFLGFIDESLVGTTDLSFSAILPFNIPAGQVVSAVVTNLDTGDSSEFSNSIFVV